MRRRVAVLLAVLIGLVAVGVGVNPGPAEALNPVPFTFVNNSDQTIWVGALGNAGKPPPNGGGWAMAPGATTTVTVPHDWGGRFWGRTGCVPNASGGVTCQTGDCGGRLQCNGIGGEPPVSLAEFTLQQHIAGASDFYDVSFVDGFNVPMTVQTIGGVGVPSDPYRCTEAGCGVDLNPNCPAELRVRDAAGRVIACKSACLAFNTDQYCCRGAYGQPSTCNPSTWPVNYAGYFKSACPRAYSYAYDDLTSTFTCTNCGYRIVFGRSTGTPPPTTPPPTTGSPGGPSAYSTIQAEGFSAQSGVTRQSTSDTGGGQQIGGIAGGDWVRFDGVRFGTTAARTFRARVASGAGAGVSGLVEVRLGSPTAPVVGSFAIANTGGWQTWRTVPANVSGVTGTHNVYLTFTSGQPAEYVNVNWFTFATS